MVIPVGYSSSPTILTMTIHKSVHDMYMYLCYDINNCTYSFVQIAFVQPLFDFYSIFQFEFLYNFGVGNALSSGAPYTSIRTSSSRKMMLTLSSLLVNSIQTLIKLKSVAILWREGSLAGQPHLLKREKGPGNKRRIRLSPAGPWNAHDIIKTWGHQPQPSRRHV